jgi:hypothetical protein
MPLNTDANRNTFQLMNCDLISTSGTVVWHSIYMMWIISVYIFTHSFCKKFEVDASHYFKCCSIKIAYKINMADKTSAGRNAG